MELLVGLLMVVLAFLTYKYIGIRKQMRDFSHYIDEAIDGDLEISDFDEEELSKLKTKLVKFLYANQVKENKLKIEKNKTKDLIADISHQTKTPITNLNLYISLLEDETKEEYIDIIKYELDKLKFLIDNLVKSSRLESDIIVLQNNTTNLSELVREVLDEFKNPLSAKNIDILFEEEECIFEMDQRWMKEAVHNLIDNAIKYSPENSVIKISIYKSYLNYNLDIENHCTGLSEEDLAKLFERFYRGINAASKDGLGLGLFIVREIVKKHGGTIKSSIDKKNIKFMLDFPL